MIRMIVFACLLVIITALYAVSKELLPPTTGLSIMRGLIAVTMVYGSWQLIKKIPTKRKTQNKG